MPGETVTIPVKFDEDIRSGDVTLAAIVSALNSQMIEHQVFKKIRHPQTNELMMVLIKMSRNIYSEGRDTISTMPGVIFHGGSIELPAIPDQLFTYDLNASAPDGLALATLILNNQLIQAQGRTDDLMSRGVVLGNLNGNGVSNAYTDVDVNFGGFPFTVLKLKVPAGSGELVLPAGDLTLNFAGGNPAPLVVANVSPIVIAASAAGSEDSYYIDETGKLYLFHRTVDGMVLVSHRTYEEAVTFGAA